MSVAGALALGAVITAATAIPAAAAPPGRAYELVSPADPLAGSVPGLTNELGAMPGLSSSDGDRVLFGAGSSMGPNWSGPSNPMIFAHRTDTGWQVRSAVRSTDEGNSPVQLGRHEPQSGWLTPDGREFVFGSIDLSGLSTPTMLIQGVYRSPDALEPPAWLSQPSVGAATGGVNMTGVAAADDTRTVAFQSSAPLTADAPPAGTQAVYVRRGGELRLASIDPNGVPFTQRMNLANSFAGHNASNPPATAMRNQLAGNGRYVLMVNGANSDAQRSLYVRDLDAGVTRQLAGVGTGNGNAQLLDSAWGGAVDPYGLPLGVDTVTVPSGFVFGARDAPRAFFHAPADQGEVPFVYDANLQTGVVTTRNAITGPPVGLSDDGAHMLFLEPPAGGSGKLPAGNWTLRYWNAANPNSSVAVGTIASPAGGRTWGLARVYRSSADGRTWIFTATGSPDPARPNVAPATHQLYRWTVGDGTPTCLTCEPTDGVARTSGVALTVQESTSSESFLAPGTAQTAATNKGKMALAQPGHSLSDDGRWLLFDSPDRLVDEDVNNVRDVYLWDRDGSPGDKLQLVTSGSGTDPSYALDLDPSGKNAFFTTREKLIPTDDDRAYDVYVARIGGGFAELPDGSCTSEATCRVPDLVPPPALSLGSGVLTPPSHGAQQPVQKGTPKLRVRSVRTSASRLTVRVDTPQAGQIRVSGANVRTTKRTAKRATTYTVRVSLSKNAQRRVADGKTVKVKLRVQFTPKGSKKSTSVSSSVSVKKGR